MMTYYQREHRITCAFGACVNLKRFLLVLGVESSGECDYTPWMHFTKNYVYKQSEIEVVKSSDSGGLGAFVHMRDRI